MQGKSNISFICNKHFSGLFIVIDISLQIGYIRVRIA